MEEQAQSLIDKTSKQIISVLSWKHGWVNQEVQTPLIALYQKTQEALPLEAHEAPYVFYHFGCSSFLRQYIFNVGYEKVFGVKPVPIPHKPCLCTCVGCASSLFKECAYLGPLWDYKPLIMRFKESPCGVWVKCCSLLKTIYHVNTDMATQPATPPLPSVKTIQCAFVLRIKQQTQLVFMKMQQTCGCFSLSVSFLPTAAAFQQGKIPPTPFPGGPPPGESTLFQLCSNLINEPKQRRWLLIVQKEDCNCVSTLITHHSNSGGPPRPGMLPTPPMGGPPMMPMMGPPPHGMMPGGPGKKQRVTDFHMNVSDHSDMNSRCLCHHFRHPSSLSPVVLVFRKTLGALCFSFLLVKSLKKKKTAHLTLKLYSISDDYQDLHIYCSLSFILQFQFPQHLHGHCETF